MITRRFALGVSCALGFFAIVNNLQATVFTWQAGTNDVATAGNWTPAGGPPHDGTQRHIARFAAAGSTTPTLTADTNFWLRQLAFDAGAQPYVFTANPGVLTYISLNAVSAIAGSSTPSPVQTALINNSSNQQVINLIGVGKLGMAGIIDSGAAAGGSLVINAPVVVSDGSTSASLYTAFAGTNDVFINVDTSINPAGNASAGEWTMGAQTSTPYSSTRGRTFFEQTGRVWLGNLGTSYSGTYHLDGTLNGAVRLTHNNALPVGSGLTGVQIYGGTTGNTTLELSNNIMVTRPVWLLQGRSGAVANDPHIRNVSGSNTINNTGDWNTSSTAGNWNFQSDSGSQLNFIGGNIYNTANLAITLQLMGDGDGQILDPFRVYKTNPSFGLTKTGAGTWTLLNVPAADQTADVKKWQGNTTISAGTLQFAPTSTSGAMNLTGSITVADAAKLAVRAPNASIAPLTVATLNLGTVTGSMLDITMAGTSSVPLTVGTLNAAVGSTNVVNVKAGHTPLATGMFPLVNYTSASGPGLTLGTLPARTTATLSNNGIGSYILDITSFDTIRWNGASGGAWDTTTFNWLRNSDNVSTQYMETAGSSGDFVTFDDSTAGGNVNVSTAVNPAAITFNNSVDYNFIGSGNLTTAGIIKNGAGKATISTTGALTAHVMEINSGTLAINRAGNDTLFGEIIGVGTFRKEGAGTMTMAGTTSTFGGTIEVAGGILKTTATNSYGTTASGTSVLSGGTLDVSGSSTGDEVVTIAGPGVGGNGALINSGDFASAPVKFLTLGGNATIGSKVYIGAGITGATVQGSGFALTKTGPGESDINLLAPNGETGFGNINIAGGSLFFSNATTSGAPAGTINISNNAVLAVDSTTAVNSISKPIAIAASGGGVYAWRTSGAGAFVASDVTIAPGGTFYAASRATNANTVLTLSGKISGSGNLEAHQVGDSTARFVSINLTSNSNDYTGTTIIGGGIGGLGANTVGGYGSDNLPGLVAAFDKTILSIGNNGSTGSIGPGNIKIIAGSSAGLESYLQFYRSGVYSLANNIEMSSTAPGVAYVYGTHIAGDVTVSGNITGTGQVKTDGGRLTLTGTNTYTGVSTANLGVLQFGKVSAFYGGNQANWTDVNLQVNANGTAAFNVGGPGEFTIPQVQSIITLGSIAGGFKSNSKFGFDTTNTPGGVLTYSNVITNTNAGTFALGISKLGTGTLVLDQANTYTGGTAVVGGTLRLGADNTLGPGGLSFGDAFFTASTGTLDMATFNQTVKSLSASSNSATPNKLLIGAGKTLTVTGSPAAVTNVVSIGGLGGSAPQTRLNVVGSTGTLTVTDATKNFVVAQTSDSTAPSQAVLDLSGLGTFNATVANMYVGRPTTAAGAATTGFPNDSLILAGQNNITVSGVIGVGGSNQAEDVSTIRLGTNNTINAAKWVLGAARDDGTLIFNSGLTNPSVTLYGATGPGSRTNIWLGDQRNENAVSNGTTGGSSDNLGTMDFTGGTVTAFIDNLVVGNGGAVDGTNGRGQGSGVFTVAGTSSSVDVNTLLIGTTFNQTTASTNIVKFLSSDSTVNVNGGSMVVNSGELILARDVDGSVGHRQDVKGTLTVYSGTLTVGSIGTPVNTILGTHTSDGTGSSTATLNINGGTMNAHGNIVQGTLGSGTIVAAVHVNSGTLNMPGHNIVLNTAGPGVLSVGSVTPTGDHNLNGTVDAADFVLWRKSPGSYGGANGYTDWRNNFGATGGSAATLDAGAGTIATDTFNLHMGTVTATGGVTVDTALNGNGTINGNVVMGAAGAVSPGPTFGKLTLANDLTLGATGVVNIGLGGTTLGNYDEIDVTGILTANGMLKVTFSGFNLQAGNSFDIFDFAPANWSGNFASYDLPGGVQTDWDLTQLSTGGTGTITYNGPTLFPGSGSGLDGGAVPEPTTLALLALAICGLASRRSNRR